MPGWIYRLFSKCFLGQYIWMYIPSCRWCGDTLQWWIWISCPALPRSGRVWFEQVVVEQEPTLASLRNPTVKVLINLWIVNSKICTAQFFKTIDSYPSPCFFHALDCLDRGSLSCWTHGVQNPVAHDCRFFCAHHFHGWSCVWWWPDGVCRGLGPGLPAYYRIGQSDPCLGHHDLYRYGPYWSCSCTADV